MPENWRDHAVEFFVEYETTEDVADFPDYEEVGTTGETGETGTTGTTGTIGETGETIQPVDTNAEESTNLNIIQQATDELIEDIIEDSEDEDDISEEFDDDNYETITNTVINNTYYTGREAVHDSGEFGEDPVDIEAELDGQQVYPLVERTITNRVIITDFSQEALARLEAAGIYTPYVLLDDDSEYEVDWSDIFEIYSPEEQAFRSIVSAINATNQKFWTDSNGVHVSEVDQTEWDNAIYEYVLIHEPNDDRLSEYYESVNGSYINTEDASVDTSKNYYVRRKTFRDISLNKMYNNVLLNSLGMIFRTAFINLVAITKSGTTFYDGFGNEPENIMALFGPTAAQIGKTSSQHAVIDSQGLTVYNSDGSLALINSINLNSVRDAATSANDILEEMQDAATQANTTLTDIYASAVRANQYSTNALNQLGVLEDVVGTLDWLQEHTTFTLTSDTTIQNGTVYYTLDQQTGDYTPVLNPNPNTNPSTSGWYVVNVKETQRDYLMNHLSVTSRGLWVLPSGLGNSSEPQNAPGYKLLLSSGGAYIYDESGHIVSSYAESIVFDSTRPQYIGGEDAYIAFYDSNSDGKPDSIRIGGSNVSIGGSSLSSVLSDIQQAKTDSANAVKTAEDIPIITLSSTNGTVFKRNARTNTTTIIATIFTPGGKIDNITDLRQRYGNSAYLQWGWRDSVTEADHVLLVTDSRITMNGFALTINSEDINTQAVITCSLVV